MPTTNGLAAVGGREYILNFTYLSASVVVHQRFFKYRPTVKPNRCAAWLSDIFKLNHIFTIRALQLC